jgi:hypothetical protein
MKVWINSSELAGKTDGNIVLNYAEEPTRENDAIGTVTQSPGKFPIWIYRGKSGRAITIEEAKEIIEIIVSVAEEQRE